jgi:hypothetical protein
VEEEERAKTEEAGKTVVGEEVEESASGEKPGQSEERDEAAGVVV